MEWVRIENRSKNGFNHYYIVGETNDLVITTQNEDDEITCRLSDGSGKKLKLMYKMYEVIYYDHCGTRIVSTTKRWFVKDGEDEHPIDEIEVLKDDIMPYRKTIG